MPDRPSNARRRRSRGTSPDKVRVPALSGALLEWYDEGRRDLPWRRTRDPYAVWVSEMMLQQTRVDTVIDYFERFMARLPTLEALANAREDEVLGLWQGLGYYSRARNLHRGAQEVLRSYGGRMPRRPEALRQLPGIGPYSAGAIASIAFDEPAAVVDGNVIRVLARLFAIGGDPKRGAVRKTFWERAEQLVPAERPGDFNQALMELGATVCTPQKPACDRCPLSQDCIAYRTGRTAKLPETTRQPKTVRVHRVAAVIVRRGRALLVQSPPESKRWQGLWLFPTADVDKTESPQTAVRRAAPQGAGATAEPEGLLTVVRHAFTHHRITLDAYQCSLRGRVRPAGKAARWWPLEDLDATPMPAPYRRIVDLLAK